MAKSFSDSTIPKKYLDVAKSLKDKYGEVTVLYVKKKDGSDSVVYLSEPRRHQKMAIIDEYLSTKQKTQAGALLIESCMIPEASDKSILAETSESDKVWIGMCIKAMNTIDFYDCEIKKKLNSAHRKIESSDSAQTNAFLRYFFHLEPNDLSDDDYYERVADMFFVIEKLGMFKKK